MIGSSTLSEYLQRAADGGSAVIGRQANGPVRANGKQFAAVARRCARRGAEGRQGRPRSGSAGRVCLYAEESIRENEVRWHRRRKIFLLSYQR